MKVLVTGGSGLIGEGAVDELRRRGHRVRILARHAGEAAREWPRDVESFEADVSEPGALAGCADGVEVVLHVAGIGAEDPPERTFENVNVQGTRRLLDAARAAGVRRFVFVSSLGAERGASAYHESKRRAEALVRAFEGEWVVVRPGNVYGPGDEVFSTLLKITRLSPVVPVIGSGDQPFEPIWHEDLARALAAAVERDDVAGRVLEVTSGERTSMSELIARLGGLEGRQPAQLPVPAGVVHIAERLAHAVGLPFPVDETKLTLLEEENVVAGENALPELIGTPTPLDEGLRRLLTTLPEQAPAEGVGNLHEKTIEADIAGTDVAPRELKRRVVSELGRVMPLETGGAAARGRSLRAGDVFTLELPLRGTVSMRVLESGPERLRLVTLEGHPIAGTAELLFEPGPRFTVRTLFRHGTLADAAAMAAGGGLLQDSMWRTVVDRVVEISGGHLAGDVRESSRVLDDEEAARVEREIADRIAARKRASRTPARRAASGPKRRKAPGSRRVRP